MSCFARSLVHSAFFCLCGVRSLLLGMPQLRGLEFILLCGQPVGFLVLVALDVLRHMRFRISGTFMSKKLALCLGRLGKSSLLLVVPLM